jgi:hypothetical protein
LIHANSGQDGTGSEMRCITEPLKSEASDRVQNGNDRPFLCFRFFAKDHEHQDTKEGTSEGHANFS